jgi:hypothetical protein
VQVLRQTGGNRNPRKFSCGTNRLFRGGFVKVQDFVERGETPWFAEKFRGFAARR